MNEMSHRQLLDVAKAAADGRDLRMKRFDEVFTPARVIELLERVEAVQQALATPEAVHINMLRGGIPKLSAMQIGHLYRDGQARAVVAEVRRQNPEAFAAEEAEGVTRG